MKKVILLLVSVLFFFTGLFSQNEKLTIQDAVLNQWRSLYPEHLSGVKAYGENNFTYVKDYNKIYKINSRKADTALLYTLDDINEVLNKAGQDSVAHFPYWNYEWNSPEVVNFMSNGIYHSVNFRTKKYLSGVKLPSKAKNIYQCKETGDYSYTIDNNLFIQTSAGKTIAVTDDQNKGIVNGDAYVHRQEFGIDKGNFWSPNGDAIAFYRKDETMVDDYPLVDVSKRIAEHNPIKYPMIGEKSEEVTLGIYSIKTGKTVFADVTDFSKERYLTSISWDPSGKYIYIGVLNRGQDHLKLNKYRASSGDFVKTLFEEKNDRYVEPENPLFFMEGTADQFIWQSERDGYNHLYLYSTKGEFLKQLTAGEWAVTGISGYDEKNKKLYFSSKKDSPIESNLYSLSLKSGTIERLTERPGTHRTVLSNSKKYILDSYSSQTVPNLVAVIEYGKMSKVILEAENPLKEYAMGDLQIGTIKAADGKTDLYYRLITPPNFDVNKKYPAIVYVYGGPHAQLVTDSWLGGARLWNYYMAQKGYVMLTVDNRGSAHRGFDFESIIHRECGKYEMQDQKAAIDFLLSKDFTDKNRIGVHGWSYGGYMTISLMTKYPELFKVGVAGGPVIDWKYYEVMYGERYMDTPEENPEGFKNTSLLNKADSLKGRLLVIHGYQDPVVVPQNSLNFKRAVIKAGTDVDYFLYPESEHNMRGKTRVHLMTKVTRYFDDFLK